MAGGGLYCIGREFSNIFLCEGSECFLKKLRVWFGSF